ncbi:MAG: hypothetical protein GX786_09765 [Clostridiales bacterium]|nr:hypothetical protein [Clostridiales bacterium]
MKEKWYLSKWVQNIVLMLVAATFSAICMVMFYRQLTPMYDQFRYITDLPAHVKALRSGGIASYSLLFYVFDLFYKLPAGSGFAVASLLTGFSLGCVGLTKRLLRDLYPEGYRFSHWVLAWCANFIMAIFIPNVTNRYLGTFSPTVWHNSTYIGMRFFSLIAVIAYFQIDKNYLKKIDWKYWLIFLVSLTLSMAIKPSFVFCFTPVMALFLLKDWKNNNWKGFKNIFLFGATVLPSIILGVMQLGILSGSGHGIHIAPFRVLWHFTTEVTKTKELNNPLWVFFIEVLKIPDINSPFTSLAMSLLYPFLSFVFLGKYLWKFKDVRMMLYAFLFAALQAILILEGGEDGIGAFDGNYTWGALVMNFFLFAVISNRVYQWVKENLFGKLTGNKGKLAIAIILGIVFLLHVYSGLRYFKIMAWGGRFV